MQLTLSDTLIKRIIHTQETNGMPKLECCNNTYIIVFELCSSPVELPRFLYAHIYLTCKICYRTLYQVAPDAWLLVSITL